MSFASLKRYLSGDRPEAACRRVICLLLDGIGAHVVRNDENEHKRLLAELERCSAVVRDSSAEEDLVAAANSAIQAFNRHSQRTVAAVRRQETELQYIASMLAQTIVAVTEGSERSSDVLSAIRCDLETAAAIEDIQKVRYRLGECLQKVQDEAIRRKREADATVTSLRDQIARARETGADSSAVDAATGLPGRQSAEEAFREALGMQGRKYVLSLVMERYDVIKSRYGVAVADESLRALREHLERRMGEDCHLFHWCGAALVALLWRKDTIDRVRAEVRRHMDAPIERTFDIGSRTALVPITAAWSVVGLIPPVANTSRRIDSFVATQTPREFAL